MLENFDIRNIDTMDENINKNINSKSIILAPFNTSIESEKNTSKEITDLQDPELKILNGVIKYANKVKDLNRNYELNNNQEIDNGVVIEANDSDEKEQKFNYKGKSPSPYNWSFSKKNSKAVSPQKEISEKKINININKKNQENNNNIFNEEALDMLQNLGYKKSFVKESIINDTFNYCTVSYKLIVKYCFS